MPRFVDVAGQKRHVQGWIPDRPDHRDFGFRGVAPTVTPQSKGFLVNPQSNNAAIMSPVQNQGQLGSCTAQGWTMAMEALRKKRSLPHVDLSPLFLYYAERVKVMGVGAGEDTGAQIRDGAKTLAKFGCCTEMVWPYRPNLFAENPPKAAWDEALQHQAIRYYRLDNLDWIKACLTLGYPVVFGFSVPEHMLSIGKEGQLYYPKAGESFVGGHCVIAYGHDDYRINDKDDIGALRCRNSWGVEWGDAGDFWMPYSYILNWLAMDFWCVHEAEV